jgi:hypothetical protein
MNQYSQEIIQEFTSKENKDLLHDHLTRSFNQPAVTQYLREHFDGNVASYAKAIAIDLNMSDPMPGVTMGSQLDCFNHQFLTRERNFIVTHVIGGEEPPAYIVRDGAPTSRRGLIHHQRGANDILETWRSSPARPVEMREDCAADIGPRNTYYGHGDKHLETGIVFCDQSHLGMQNHIAQYEDTAYKRALNNQHEDHTSVPFGVSTPWSDARLMQRRVFRSNESGVENGIPNYESRLYRRNLERDVSEGLRSAEKGYLLSGHDMSSLYRRVDFKNAARARWTSLSPTPGQQGTMINNINIPDEYRYS